MKLRCWLFHHRIIGDNFYGHHCKRCGLTVDWGILEPYRKPIPYGTVLKIPKFSGISARELEE